MCSLLLVDDDLRILELYGIILEHAGHHVQVAETCARAVTLLKETDPEIVIMDLRVPELEDGLGLIRTLKAHVRAPGKRPLRVVVTSGWTEDLDGTPVGDSVDCVLPKPVRMELLLRSIARLAPAAVGH
jgi:CheY-like chemotaxis protein